MAHIKISPEIVTCLHLAIKIYCTIRTIKILLHRHTVQTTLGVTIYDFNLLHIISTLVSGFSVSVKII
jgi:hypothetical protein